MYVYRNGRPQPQIYITNTTNNRCRHNERSFICALSINYTSYRTVDIIYVYALVKTRSGVFTVGQRDWRKDPSQASFFSI